MTTTSSESRGDFVAIDPYERAKWWMYIKYSTLWSTWTDMLFFTLVACAVVFADRMKAGLNLGIPPTMLTILGTVIGFCISYRTSSAYERFIEGRKSWQQVQVATRNAARMIWFHIPNMTKLDLVQGSPEQEADAARALIEKKTMLNVLEAFAVSLKHYLRGESGIHYADLYHLVLFLPKYQLPNATPIHRQDLGLSSEPVSRTASSSNMLDTSEITEIGQMEDEKRQQPGDIAASGSKESIGNKAGLRFRQNTTISGSSQSSSSERKFGPRFPDKPLLPAHNPPPFSIIDDVLPFLRIGRSLFKFGRKQAELLLDEKAAEARTMKKKYKKVYSGSNIPLECVLHISNWIGALQRRKTIDATIAGKLLDANASLADALSGLERVLTTPLPFSYALHLKHVTWLYLTILPFQLLPTLGYLTIPATFIAGYTFLGFLEIGSQIEQPLGYDATDLDMGAFAANIRKELREVAAMPPIDPSIFIFSEFNEPLGSADTRSAAELMEASVDVDDIECALARESNRANGVERSYTDYREAKMHEKAERSSIMLGYMPKVKKEGSMV